MPYHESDTLRVELYSFNFSSPRAIFAAASTTHEMILNFFSIRAASWPAVIPIQSGYQAANAVGSSTDHGHLFSPLHSL
jgi:hypothetical protein